MTIPDSFKLSDAGAPTVATARQIQRAPPRSSDTLLSPTSDLSSRMELISIPATSPPTHVVASRAAHAYGLRSSPPLSERPIDSSIPASSTSSDRSTAISVPGVQVGLLPHEARLASRASHSSQGSLLMHAPVSAHHRRLVDAVAAGEMARSQMVRE